MLPKGLKFDFKPVLIRVTTLGLYVLWTGRFSDLLLEGEHFKVLVDRSLSALGLTGAARRPIEECLAPFYGQKLTNERLSDIGWRLAAGYSSFAKGKAIMNDFLPGFGEHWAPMMIESVRGAMLSKMGKAQLELSFRIFDGPYGGLCFKQRMPYRFVTAIMAKDIGFPRFTGLHYLEMSGMWLAGLIMSDRWGLRLNEFAPTAASLDHNRDLRKRRKDPCLRGFDCVCHRCVIGYDGGDPCIRAVHRWTFVERACPVCDKEFAMFDLASNSLICVECEARKFKAITNKQRFGD